MKPQPQPKPAYVPVESIAPLRGLATTPASTRLDPAYSPSLMNCVIRDGEVRRRGGYQQLGQRLVGRVLALVEFGELAESRVLVALTSHRQYYYSTGTGLFVDLTPGQASYTITANPSTTSFRVATDLTAEFTAGRLFPVVGGANEGVYTVASSSFGGGNTTIVVEETLPDSLTVAGAIILADDFETDERGTLSYASLTDVNGHRLLVTNGNDIPRVWDGDTGAGFEDWTPTFTDFVTCDTVAVFAEHLFLGGITNTTGYEPQTIAWSDAGDFEDFETGQAGIQILYQLDDIKALEVLGDRLTVYSSDAAMTGVYVGNTAVFAFDLVIPEGLRLASPTILTSINVGHVFASQENFYLFDGTRGLRIIGDMIYSHYKANKDQELLYRSASLNDHAKRTLYFAIPDVAGGTNVYTVEYDVFNLSNMSWGLERYSHDPTAFGFFTNHTEELTWEDASWEPADMPWEDELGAWAEEAEQLEFPIRCFGTLDGDVFLATEGVLTDDGVAAEQRYETMDFSLPEVYESVFTRWGEIEVEMSGTEVDVAISVDRGRNWTSVETLTLTDSYESYRVPIDYSGRTIRVRFTTTTSFRLRWVRLWGRPGGPA